MKKLLNPNLQEEKMIEIEVSSSEEDTQSRRIEDMIYKALESIEENIRSILDVPVNKFIDKGKEVTSILSEGTSRKKSCAEKVWNVSRI